MGSNPTLDTIYISIMKKIILKKKIEILQIFADFIINRLKKAKNDYIFNYWLNIGLLYNYWCIENNFYLN